MEEISTQILESENPEILSATGKRWELRAIPSEDQLVELLAIKGLNPVVANILVQREIFSEDELRSHFNPDLSMLHDPFLMKDMDKAVSRLVDAMAGEERIMIYGDYDVDGTTSTALVYKYLSKNYPHIECYIPDRYGEGYGVSFAGIDTAEANQVSLIIALDCGIKAIDKVLYAKEKGIDFIICDHHLPGPEIPDAVAVLDPKRTDCDYPYKELSGCGVGFKLMQALVLDQGWEMNDLYELLDLVAISIASDIVPLTGENRLLMHHGLKRINEMKASAGIQALMDLAGFKTRPDNSGYQLKVENLVFGLGPRINAAGRIGHGLGAVNLLIANSIEEAVEFAGKVDGQNVERKELDKNITEEALELIETSEEMREAFSTVLFQPHWHKGVIGIVASRCIEKFYRPTIILTESDGKITGSARSIFGFDLYTALEACSEHLLQFGGHYFAAGLTLLPENLDEFRAAFEAQVRQKLTRNDLFPRQVADMEIRLSDVKAHLMNQIARLGPFGPFNMTPVFLTRNVSDTGLSRFLESKTGGSGHIKFNLTSEDLNIDGQLYALDGIGFGMGDHWHILTSGKPFDLLYTIEENEFKGQKKIQLMVKDIRQNSNL